MNGAECLLRTLLANKVDVCFMNPGTSEMQFVTALDRIPGVRPVLCLFEGVCSGAADAYARMTGTPAATLLHLGPGLANGLANFHNARKSRSPVVSIVGDHATGHRTYDAPLTADVASFARTVSGHVRVLEHAEQVGTVASETVRASMAPPGQVATLIVPADISWSEAGAVGPAIPRPVRRIPAFDQIRGIAAVLRSGEPAALFLGGSALLANGTGAAGSITAATGARVYANRYCARISYGGGRFLPERLAYFPEAAESQLAGLRHMILVEAQPPVSFFAYPDTRSYLAPQHCQMHQLATEEEDGAAALEALAAECGPVPPVSLPPSARPGIPAAPLTPDTIGRLLATLLPDDAVVTDELVSSTDAVWKHLAAAAPHDILPVTGGAIGQGLPAALGAALACPSRKVIALEADGSGMYTPQALWTMARERLDVITVIFANHRYRILQVEMRRAGLGEIGRFARDMTDLQRPALDWVKLGAGLGVSSTRAATTGEFAAQFAAALRESGPHLIEAVLDSAGAPHAA